MGAEHGLDGDVADLAADEHVQELLQGWSTASTPIAHASSSSSASSILPRDFTMEDGEITPTMKLKRRRARPFRERRGAF